jgi:hypothetical protein
MTTYSISRQIWKWLKWIFFHLLDLSILTSFIHLSSGSKLSDQHFRLALARDLIRKGGMVLHPQTTLRGRQTPFASHLTQFDVWHSEHWHFGRKKNSVFFFCKKKTEMRTKLICPKCNVEA